MQQKTTTRSIVEVTETAKILSDETRVAILDILCRNPEGMCVFEIAEAVSASPSATSHQLAKLEAKNIVKGYREGQRMCYMFKDTRSAQVIKKALAVLR